MSSHTQTEITKHIEYYIDEHTDYEFDKLSKRTKETIEKSPEFQEMKAERDRVPF